MKNLYKILLIIFCIVIFVTCIIRINVTNPWVNCKDDLRRAEKISGFTFPLVLSNYTVSAMKDMIEITYPLDEFRDVTIRKTTLLYDKLDNGKNYSIYPIKDILVLNNGVKLTVRKKDDLIYVAYLAADSGYYSIYCQKGMTSEDVWQIYNVLAEVETH